MIGKCARILNQLIVPSLVSLKDLAALCATCLHHEQVAQELMRFRSLRACVAVLVM
jgi:hypothetical protein